MEGGVVKYGNLIVEEEDTRTSHWYYFCIISGADAYFSVRYIEIIFLRNMNNFAYLEGGTICLEYVKIGNEINKWDCPIIYVACFVTSVTV
jgi:hypothetical protein